MKFVDLLNVSATLSAGVLTPGAALNGGRTLVQAIADGDVALTDTALAVVITDGTSRELGLYNVGGTAQAPTLTRTSVLRTSAGGTTAVAFAGGATLTAYSDAPASFLNTLVSTTQGVAPSGLTVAGTLADSNTFLLSQDGANVVTGTLLALKTYIGAVAADTTAPSTPTGLASSGVSATAATLSWTASTDNSGVAPTYEVSKDGSSWTAVSASPYNWSTLTASTTYTMQVRAVDGSGNRSAAASLQVTTSATADTTAPAMSGSVTTSNVTSTSLTMAYSAGTDNVGITRYDVSVDTGTASWTSNGTNLSYGATVLTANTAYTARVRAVDAAGNISNVLTASVTTSAAPTETLTVNTPATQTVGTPYNVTGTYANGTPTALDYSIDSGTTWTAAASPTISGGTYSFSITPTTASASRTMMVRDHNSTSVTATSGTYVVNAAAATMASLYLLTSTNSATASFAPATMSGTAPDQYATTQVRVNIRSALTTSATYPANADVKFVWGKKGFPCPTTFAASSIPAGSTNGNGAATNSTAIGTASHLGGWTDSSSGFFGTFTPLSNINAWGTPGTYILWIMYSDGSTKAYDNNTGTALEWVLS